MKKRMKRQLHSNYNKSRAMAHYTAHNRLQQPHTLTILDTANHIASTYNTDTYNNYKMKDSKIKPHSTMKIATLNVHGLK
eukprot:5659764-Karenia_brevis.AAC.1